MAQTVTVPAVRAHKRADDPLVMITAMKFTVWKMRGRPLPLKHWPHRPH